MWQLDFLGPPRLRRNGNDHPLPLKKGQALLLLLALRGALSRVHVVALLWPGLDETTARRNLRRELARLREIGVSDVVFAQGDQLGLAHGVVTDAAAFECDLQAKAPDDALHRWRGDVAEGLALPDAPEFVDWLAQQRGRWRQLRAQALEASAAACELRGDWLAALTRVQSLLEQDPLQEQRHRDAIRLHAALGQREAALAQYERCRVLLRDELGLAPMAQTEALVAQLRHPTKVDPLTGAAGDEARLPTHGSDRAVGATLVLPEPLPFVGRAEALRALEAGWRTGCSLLIEGDAGIGKTRLAIEFIGAHGPHAVARCRPSDRTVPFAAFCRAIRAMVGPSPAHDVLPADVVGELARLLPELGPPPAPLRDDAERARFIEACIEAWHSLAAENFDAVVLDDWHHADTASRDLLSRIAERRHERRSPGTVGAREVLVYRVEGGRAERAAHAGTDDAASDAGAACTTGPAEQDLWPGGGSPALRLRLGSLSPAALMDLMQQLSGVSAPARFTQRLVDVTAGNPFFVAEALRHWAEQGLLTADGAGLWKTPFDGHTQDYRELPVPDTVHATVLDRVQRQGGACLRVLEAAAVAGEPFAPTLLAPACALSELDAVIAIDLAVQARLLREHETGGFAFAHDLVQQAIDRALAPERRRLLHRRLALAAEATGAAAATIAVHHEACGEPRRAVPFRLRAGDEAQRLHAWREAEDHWQQGVADRPSPAQAVELNLRLLQAASAQARRTEVHERGRVLHELAQDDSLPLPLRVRATTQAAHYLANWGAAAAGLAALDRLPRSLPLQEQREVVSARATVLLFLGRNHEAGALVRGNLDEPDLDDRQRAQALYQLGAQELLAGRQAAACEHLETAIALQRDLADGSPFDLLRMTFSHGTVLYQLGRFEEAAALQEETAAGALRTGHRRMEARARFNLSTVRIAQLRPDAALEVAQQVRDLPMEKDVEFSAMLRCRFVEAHAMSGRLGAAWSEAREAVPEVLAAARPYTMMSVATFLAELLELLGDRRTLPLLLETLDRLDDADGTLLAGLAQIGVEMWVARAQAAMLAGDHAAADKALNRIAADQAIEDLRVRHRARIARAELALLSGRAEDAAALLPAPAEITPADGLRVRAWAVHVRTAAATHTLGPDLLGAAREALRIDAPQALPAVPALHLHRALADAARSFPSDRAAAPRADASAFVHRLASDLTAWPDVQAAFLRRWLP